MHLGILQRRVGSSAHAQFSMSFYVEHFLPIPSEQPM
ncbi:unnamed protein product [Staurois parvus]|uniref:Uncharacterized protein n=1 Tax=Staurois parvus TaxID=386267 RepID=A0ABN9BVP1_9NEOB|nr:unnamed protein product [Staurois parvus]